MSEATLTETAVRAEAPAQTSPAPTPCCMPGCRVAVPAPLAAERLCLMHFTDAVEQACARMRREAVAGPASEEYREKTASYITEYGVMLAQVATSDLLLPDPMKRRVLSTLLTLMILRESLSRCASRVVCISSGSRPPAA